MWRPFVRKESIWTVCPVDPYISKIAHDHSLAGISGAWWAITDEFDHRRAIENRVVMSGTAVDFG
jgi:hypothetical protein